MRTIKSIVLLLFAVVLSNLLIAPAFSSEQEDITESPTSIESLGKDRIQRYRQFCLSQDHEEMRLAEEDGEIVVYCYN